MDSARYDVAELQKIERALMRHNRGIFTERQPWDDNVFAVERRVVSQSIQTPSHSDVSIALRLVGEQGS